MVDQLDVGFFLLEDDNTSIVLQRVLAIVLYLESLASDSSVAYSPE